MEVIDIELKDAKVVQPKVWGDSRGFFFESFNQRDFNQKMGLEIDFVQDNHSRSAKHVLRGLHYQLNNAQGKLVRVVNGEVYDVIVDLRKSSPSFGKWFGIHLSESNKTMLWIPAGFAHGFVVLSDSADFLYKTTNYYDASSERSIRWDDPDLKIAWPIKEPPTLSVKDSQGTLFKSADLFT